MFKKFKIKEYIPQRGDIVSVSKRNLNYLGTDISAYYGFEGVISEVYTNNSFCIFSGHSSLVVPVYKNKKFYVCINGIEFKIKKNNIQ
jgi:hypothetical protein